MDSLHDELVGCSYLVLMMWHGDDVDSVHVERIGRSGEQLLKNVRC